jgi:lipopolysaccharide transport system ATP-binding protein
LAVGDMEFQKKCIGKMQELSSQSNRTIVFVSHDLSAISNLTQKTILLDEGKIEVFDNSINVIQRYTEKFKTKSDTCFPKSNNQPYFKNIELKTSHSTLQVYGTALEIQISLAIPAPVDSLEFSYQILDNDNEPIVYNWFSTSKELESLIGEKGVFRINIKIPSLKLYKGHYCFRFYLSDPRGKTVYQTIEHILPFEVQMQNIYNEWGWQDNVCKYIEDYRINIEPDESIS